tara:strand:+ start:1492 stop:1722 length:231 start_codon:yes stop_codon:yes gene_type:complete
MITENPKTSVWNQAEELVGIYPSPDELRNAIHAVITKPSLDDIKYGIRSGSPVVLHNVEWLAREYEAVRGTTQKVG